MERRDIVCRIETTYHSPKQSYRNSYEQHQAIRCKVYRCYEQISQGRPFKQQYDDGSKHQGKKHKSYRLHDKIAYKRHPRRSIHLICIHTPYPCGHKGKEEVDEVDQGNDDGENSHGKQRDIYCLVAYLTNRPTVIHVITIIQFIERHKANPMRCYLLIYVIHIILTPTLYYRLYGNVSVPLRSLLRIGTLQFHEIFIAINAPFINIDIIDILQHLYAPRS